MPATASTRAHVRAAFACGILAFAGFAACLAPVHLDPTSASSGVGGASGGSGCRSNPDCFYPTQVCDTVTQTCVGCLVASDCAYLPGSVCSGGQCVCPEGGCDAGSCPECGSGGMGGGADAGHEDAGHPDAGEEDAGKKDAGGAPDAGGPSCVTCNKALASGGTVCAGPSSTDYKALTTCACELLPGNCTTECMKFCENEGIAVLACNTCLAQKCALELMSCETH